MKGRMELPADTGSLEDMIYFIYLFPLLTEFFAMNFNKE